MVSAFSLQCSKADIETDELSLPPVRPSPENPDSISDPVTPDSIPDSTTGEGNVVWNNGYANYYNAWLTVNSLTAIVAPDLQQEVTWLDGSADPMASNNTISELLLQDDGSVYVAAPNYPYGSESMLYVPGWETPLIYHWDLEYVVVQQAGQPDEITISGTGRGSHFWTISFEAWVKSEVTFEFRGVQIAGSADRFEGNFTLEERSPEEKYNLSLSGSATLHRKQEGE